MRFKECFLTEKYLAIAMEYAAGGDMYRYVIQKCAPPLSSPDKPCAECRCISHGNIPMPSRSGLAARGILQASNVLCRAGAWLWYTKPQPALPAGQQLVAYGTQTLYGT